MSNTMLISVSDTVYSICREAKTTWNCKCLNFAKECLSPKGDHRNINISQVRMTKRSAAESWTPGTPLIRQERPRNVSGPSGTPKGPPRASYRPWFSGVTHCSSDEKVPHQTQGRLINMNNTIIFHKIITYTITKTNDKTINNNNNEQY